MPIIRLIREVREPGESGPWNGQYALQRALRRDAPEWLRIGGALAAGEIPWFWCWLDGDAAALCAQTGHPFVAGPNILFADSRRPCRLPAEREICAAANCRLLCTESAWYAELIEAHRGPANRAPIVLWPYPIDPQPGEPLPAEFDVLIYQKGGEKGGDRPSSCGHHAQHGRKNAPVPFRGRGDSLIFAQTTIGTVPRAELIEQLRRRFPRSRSIVYGQYKRAELFYAARRSRCCVYLSDDDRGPLALAEILLAGCPAVGVWRGAPFIRPGQTGFYVGRLSPEQCIDAVQQCHTLDRRAVAAVAAEQFDARRIVATIVRSLQSNCS